MLMITCMQRLDKIIGTTGRFGETAAQLHVFVNDTGSVERSVIVFEDAVTFRK